MATTHTQLLDEVHFPLYTTILTAQRSAQQYQRQGHQTLRGSGHLFEIPIDPDMVDTLVLHEGAGMKLMTADDITGLVSRIAPYDLTILRLHILLSQSRAGGTSVQKIR